MNWYRVELSEDEIREDVLWKIQEQFERIYMDYDIWRITALYSQRQAKNLREIVYLYCEWDEYAALFCRLVSMSPCDPPSVPPRDDLSSQRVLRLLIGDARLDEDIRATLREDKVSE